MRGGRSETAAGGTGEGGDYQDPSESDHAMALEADVTALGGTDYDPTAENAEDDLSVFAQGQLEGSSINRQVTVERVRSGRDVETRSEQAMG